MLSPRRKSPLQEKNLPRKGSNPRCRTKQHSEPNTLPTSPRIRLSRRRLYQLATKAVHAENGGLKVSGQRAADAGAEERDVLPLLCNN